jgi:hypothetical protein
MGNYKIKKQKSLTIIAFLAIIFISPAPALADAITNATAGLGVAAGRAYGAVPQGDIPTLVGKIIGAALSFIGLLFFLLIIYGGFLWMTARGNQQQTTQALDLIIAAVIGMVIVAAAYLITQYVGETVLGYTTS